MTSPELHGYHTDYPICDSHLHIYTPFSMETTVRTFTDMMDFFHCDRFVLHPLSTRLVGIAPTRNLRALYCKDRINSASPDKHVYVFGSLVHYADGRDTSEGYLRQAKELMAMGCDGIKMLEGKPGVRKRLGLRLDDPILDKFYAYLEENQILVTMHLGDPPEFWDKSKMSEYEINAGWFCDESYPTLEQLRSEVVGMLTKFPRLRLNLAHFFFLSHDLEASAEFLDTWPNVTFGLTPGDEMYAGFSKRPAEWKAFFQKYADRLHFGTDSNDRFSSENPEDYDANSGVSYNLIRRMLETDAPFPHKSYGILQPLHLDGVTLKKIYRDNFLAHFGETPRSVNHVLAAQAASNLLTLYEHNLLPQFTSGEIDPDFTNSHKFTMEEQYAADQKNLQILYQYFNG